MQTKTNNIMSPIDSIINMLESYAADARSKATVEDPNRDNYNYQRGKADGLSEAAEHIRNLQRLFN